MNIQSTCQDCVGNVVHLLRGTELVLVDMIHNSKKLNQKRVHALC